jgi:hypothetical protein
MACLQNETGVVAETDIFLEANHTFFTECDSIILAIQCLAKFM